MSCNIVLLPDLNKVSGDVHKIEGTAATKQDDKHGAEKLRDEGSQDGHGAGLFQVGNADDVVGPHAEKCLLPYEAEFTTRSVMRG